MNNDLLAYGSSVERLLNSIKADLDKFFKTHTHQSAYGVLHRNCLGGSRGQTCKNRGGNIQTPEFNHICCMASREAVPEGEESGGLDFEDGPESSEDCPESSEPEDDDVMHGIPEEEDTSAAASAREAATVPSTAGIDIFEAIDFQTTPSTEPPVLHTMTVLALEAYVKERVIVIPARQKCLKEQFPHLNSGSHNWKVWVTITLLMRRFVTCLVV